MPSFCFGRIIMRQIKRYLDNGYINMKGIIEEPDLPFMFLWGGRATGKSFGALEWAKRHCDSTYRREKFIYLRRTDKQLTECTRASNNPFKPLNDMFRWNIIPQRHKDYGLCFFECDEVDGHITIADENPYGYMLALSTVSNVRGLSYEDVSLIIYDEFMKMPTERAMKGEGWAFADLYESVNRNREFAGKPPVKVVCLSNANDLANDLFVFYHLVDRVEFMVKNNKMQYLDYGRGFGLLRFDDSRISKQKQNTALYRFTGKESNYSKFALNNSFKECDIPTIIPQPLNEYRSIAFIHGLCIYEHKSQHKYYCTFHKSGSPIEYDDSEIDNTRFCRKFIYLWEAHLNENVYFETYEIYRIFEKIFLR